MISVGRADQSDKRFSINLFSKMSDLAIGSSQIIKAHISGKVIGEVRKGEIFEVANFAKNVFFYCPEVNKECEDVELTSFSPTEPAEYKVILQSVEISGLFELNQNIYMNVGAQKFNPHVVNSIFKVNLVNFVLSLLAFLVIRGGMSNPENKVGYEQRMVFWLSIFLVLKNQPFTSLGIEISENLFFVELAFTTLFHCYLIYFWVTMLYVSIIFLIIQ